MSNISFNFLTESFLFNEVDTKFSKRTIDEIEDEINNYREYIISNLNELNSEIYKNYNFIQPITIHSKLPSMDELLQGSIFLDTYIIDDPIFRFDIKQIKMGNVERYQMGFQKESDEEIKNELSEIVNYMKSLTSGVNVAIGYIKFYPLGLYLNNYFKPIMRLPDISTNTIDQNVFNWFFERINLNNLKKDTEGLVIDDNLLISNYIAIKFDDDKENGSIICHYQSGQIESIINNHARIRFDGNYIPNKTEYDNWVNQEIIKAIKERLTFYSYRDYICNKFNSPIILNSPLEKQFYKKNFDDTTPAQFHNLGFNLNIPGLQNISFDKAMEIRNNTHSSFVSLQQKINEDSKALRTASDYRTYKLTLEAINQDYEEAIKSTNLILNSLKSLINPSNIFNLLLFGESYYTGNISNFTTGVTILNGMYNAKNIIQNTISNPLYFLKKIAKH